MALIKSHNAAAVLQDAIVLDLGDLRRQADELKRRAHAQAQQIITEAREQARRLTENAEAKGFEAGFAAGQKAGHDAGRKQGHDQALRDTAASLTQLQDAWINAAHQWDAQRRTMVLDARQSLVALSVALAERIVRRVPQVDPSIITDQVAAALEHVARPCDVAIRIHPADRPLLTQAMPRLLAELTNVQHAALIDDDAIAPGGCLVTAGQGRIDATLDTQLAQLVDALLPLPQTPPAAAADPTTATGTDHRPDGAAAS
jgi:flagellar biosynthesis/type III secretory pathway protein FliH